MLSKSYTFDSPHDETNDKFQRENVQWSTANGKIFVPTGRTVPTLTPGYYDIGNHPSVGIYLEKVPVKLEGILDFPEANTHIVLDEIQKFWDREEYFRRFKLAYKRGIILWGPPGGGKTSIFQLVSRDVISRGGIVVKFDNPYYFSQGFRYLREIQPDVPVVVLMEDIDSLIRTHSETSVINILDGVDQMDKVVFLASTNYPENLGDRIMNRPSRFDKRLKIGYPTANSRRMYLEFLVGENTIENMNLEQWVEDTEKFSIAHLKELFVSVNILGNEYPDVLSTLKSMKTVVSSEQDGGNNSLGFAKSRQSGESFER